MQCSNELMHEMISKRQMYEIVTRAAQGVAKEKELKIVVDLRVKLNQIVDDSLEAASLLSGIDDGLKAIGVQVPSKQLEQHFLDSTADSNTALSSIASNLQNAICTSVFAEEQGKS